MVLALVVVVIVVGAAGWFVYQRNKPSKVSSPTVKAQLAQTSAELKKINLAQIKQTADSVSGVQTSFNYKKANGK
jgi:predicted negative regulator of RcsB-dependent stress response